MMENTHGGDARAVAKRIGLNDVPEPRMDFSVNVNPLGPPSGLTAVLAAGGATIDRYPQAWAEDAAAALAEAHGVNAESVIVGNGSTEIFSWILYAVRPRRSAWVIPTYSGYEDACRSAGIVGVPVSGPCPENNFRVDLDHLRTVNADMIFLASPNNPTGVTLPASGVIELAQDRRDCWIVLDESFVDFLPDAQARTLVSNDVPSNMIIVKSLTKFFAVPGLRVGMACASPDTIARLQKVRSPWSVNALAQAACAVFYKDREYVEKTRRVVQELRTQLAAALSRIPELTVFPSEANYLLVRLPGKWPAGRLQAELLRRGILIRSCHNFAGLGESYCRLAVRPREENEELVSTLESLIPGDSSSVEKFVSVPDFCAQPTSPRSATAKGVKYGHIRCAIVAAGGDRGGRHKKMGHSQKFASAIMVVGTASNAGKTVISAALCRYFARRGCRVAPFKAQNMSLNSFVTCDGGEMAGAQVTQAKAAGVAPHTDMNPVLLKPTGEAGAQVIVNGRALGNVTASEYYAEKDRFRAAAWAAYDRLSSRYDLIIVEGAGSPAEINLLDKDFVNMSMAEHAGARTILVADIDKGGVFASILGTVSLLPVSQRGLLGGVIINKFRGDVSLLEPGICEIEKITGISVLGVVPHIRDLCLEEEDSLGLENRRQAAQHIPDIDTEACLDRLADVLEKHVKMEVVEGWVHAGR